MRDELQDQINAWVSPPADRLPSPTLFLGAAFGGSGGYGDYAHSGTTGLIEVGGKGHLAGTRAFAQIALLFVPGTYTVSYDFPLAGGGAGESKLNPGLGGGMSGLLGLSFGHLDVGVGPEGTFSEFDTDANTLVTIPRECVWTDGVCVEQAQPGATNSGASGLYQPALGYARETKGVVFRLGATLDLRYRFDISSSNAICAVFKLSWMNSRVTGENSTDGFWWQSVDALGGLAFELGD